MNEDIVKNNSLSNTKILILLLASKNDPYDKVYEKILNSWVKSNNNKNIIIKFYYGYSKGGKFNEVFALGLKWEKISNPLIKLTEKQQNEKYKIHKLDGNSVIVVDEKLTFIEDNNCFILHENELDYLIQEIKPKMITSNIYIIKNSEHFKPLNFIEYDNDIRINIRECPGNILKKTLLVFEYVNKKYEFDYLLRTCLCSYVDIHKLINIVDNLPPKKVFAGSISRISISQAAKYNLDRINFICGANMLLSRDVLQCVINNKDDIIDKYKKIDDVAISKVINEHYINEKDWIKLRWISLNEKHINNFKFLTENKNYHYHFIRDEYDKIIDFHQNYICYNEQTITPD